MPIDAVLRARRALEHERRAIVDALRNRQHARVARPDVGAQADIHLCARVDGAKTGAMPMKEGEMIGHVKHK